MKYISTFLKAGITVIALQLFSELTIWWISLEYQLIDFLKNTYFLSFILLLKDFDTTKELKLVMLKQLRQDIQIRNINQVTVKSWNFLIHFRQRWWAKQSLLTVRKGRMKPYLLHSCSTVKGLYLKSMMQPFLNPFLL